MNSIIFKYLSFLILSSIWNNILSVNANDFRTVKTHQFQKGEYYDTIIYEWDITPTDKVGMLDYNYYADGAVSTLLMNSTDYYNWQNYYYPEWLKNREYTFSYLNKDLRRFNCESPVAACSKFDIKFPDKKLYIVVLRTTDDSDITYTFQDNLERLKDKSAKLVYDPKYPPQTTVKTTNSVTSTVSTTLSNTSSPETTTSVINSAVSPQANNTTVENDPNGINNINNINGNNGNSTTSFDGINANNTNDSNNPFDNYNNNGMSYYDDTSKDVKDNKSEWLWPLIVFGTLFILLLASFLYASKNNKKNEIDSDNDNSILPISGIDKRSGKAKIPYNPHHAIKRVAYHYESDDIVVERDSILEITKRYNDGWAAVINPKDGKECLIPLIVLEGDINEDLTNIPVEEKSPKNILATPESLYENQYISRKDYEEMKRNDEWIKKVKLMKYGKPDSSQNAIVDNEQFKYVSHPITETIENDISQSRTNNNRKSMVATVVNSNTDLLSADHILEVCDEEDYDYEPEQGVIMKDDF